MLHSCFSHSTIRTKSISESDVVVLDMVPIVISNDTVDKSNTGTLPGKMIYMRFALVVEQIQYIPFIFW